MNSFEFYCRDCEYKIQSQEEDESRERVAYDTAGNLYFPNQEPTLDVPPCRKI